MRNYRREWAIGIAALALGGGVALAQTPPPATPQVHHSACALAESMAGSLRKTGKPWEVAQAQEACKTLVPTMDKANAAEFLRCCMQRLTGAPAAPVRTPSGERSQGT